MGCTSAKQLAVPNEDDQGQSKAYTNGDAFSEEHKTKGGEKVKYDHGEEDQLNTSNKENLKKNTVLHRGKSKDQGDDGNKISVHSSESQQEFFRMLDEKIEMGRDYCSEGEDVT
ncbi:uncharacterized protein C1orf21 homolog [Engraulis encrasicolus]|uniref:uncharacterized protein C1orf21 homolog n=1 Tax=Engraulis encrasicolus TaxID=184585 RepID=UPI002FD429B6